MQTPLYETLEDFLRDNDFRMWVAGNRPQDRPFWQEWLEQNPHKRELYEQAAALSVVLRNQSDSMSPDQVQNLVDKIKRSIAIQKPLRTAGQPQVQRSNPFGLHWLVAATGIAALLAIGLFLRQSAFNTTDPVSPIAVQQPIIEAKETWKEIINTSKQARLILLPDGSSVLLSQGGQLRYDEKLAKREVCLRGEGFFEVVKDAKRPFLVYTSSLTTRVLGTSFQVMDSQNDRLAYVNVKTGRVTVHSTRDPARSLVLVVNEQARLDTRTDKLTKQHIRPADQATSPILAESLDFEFTPVTDVLDKLEAVYHTGIVFDRKNLQHCTFKGDLNGLPFTEKINLVCLAIEASYEQRNGQIVIKGHGCPPPSNSR